MNDVHEVDAFGTRLRLLLRTPLPGAPATLLDRLQGMPSAEGGRAPSRLRLLIVPALIAALLVAVAIGTGAGPTPTPTPTPSPPWSTGLFEPVPVDAFDGAVAMDDVWTIGDGLAGMVWGVSNGAERADLVRSDDGRSWTLVAPPRAGFVVSAGTLANGRVHVIGYTGTLDDPTWWHEALDRDGNWHELGQVTGIPASTRVIELGHRTVGWLARISVRVPADLNDTESQIRISSDGLEWTDPAVPDEYESPAMYTGVGTDGTALLVFRYFDTDASIPGVQPGRRETAPTEVLRWTHGEGWEVNEATPAAGGPRFMAFDGVRFAGVGSAPGTGTVHGSVAAAWFSESGQTWQQGFLDPRVDPMSESLRAVTASLEGGFVAVGSTNGDIWTSTDGKTWHASVYLGAGETWNPYAVAVLHGEYVVAGAGADGRATVWVRRPSPAVVLQ